MTRITKAKAATPTPREYRSELRQQQAQDTRSRILDAGLRMTVDGVAGISVPNLARAAGVSVPTVYRHFKTKQDLLVELYPHALRRSGRSLPPPPTSLADLRRAVAEYVAHLDSLDEVMRVAMASPAAEEVRAQSMGRRLEAFRPLIEGIEPPLSNADRERILRLLVVLTQSSALRTLRDHLGQSPEQVAADVDAFIRAAVAAAQRRKAP